MNIYKEFTVDGQGYVLQAEGYDVEQIMEDATVATANFDADLYGKPVGLMNVSDNVYEVATDLINEYLNKTLPL